MFITAFIPFPIFSSALSTLVLVPVFLGFMLPAINERATKKRIKEEQEASNLIEKISTNLKQSKRARSAILLGAVALSIGCGAFVDHVRNKKAEAMRKTIEDLLVEAAAERSFDDLVSVCVNGKLASEIYHKAKKIYPLKRVEIIKSKVIK